MGRRLGMIGRDEGGAAAAEMALVLPGVAFLLFGSLYLCMMVYATTSLHSAVQAAARYASVTTAATGSDPGSTAVTAYAAKIYRGPASTTFTYATNGTCGSTGANGYSVTGSGTFPLFYGFGSKSVALSATACFP